jgi:rubrerythrin
MFSASEILDLAIQIEENAEHFYHQAMGKFSDQSLVETLSWFAEQEKRHRDFFIKMKRSLTRGGGERWAEQLSGAMLRDGLADHLFSTDEVDLDSIRDVKMFFQIAIDLEQDSVTFYEIIASFVSDLETLNQLNAIIDEELKHIELFRQRLKSLDG